MRSIYNARAACAYTAGQQHLLFGAECQDRAFALWKNDVLCAVLADGAGSVENSEISAEAVVHALAEDFLENSSLWLSVDDDLLKQHIICISNQAAELAGPGIRPDCTLLLYGQAGQRSILVHVGDGVAIGCGGSAVLLSRPENGSDISLTYFLSGPNTPSHIRIIHDPDSELDTIILSSDGAEHLLYDQVTETPAQAVQIMAEWIRENDEETVAGKLKETMDTLFRKHSPDDLSIAVIYRGESDC